MSQKGARKSQNATVVIEEKEKADNPVKEMKKKIAANAEKDKQTAEKADKPPEKNDKSEPATDKQKPTEKTDKNTDKSEKNEKVADKKTEKNEKVADKKPEKQDNKVAEKKSEKMDKSGDKKADKSFEKKAEQAERDETKGDQTKEKAPKPHNGTANGAAAAGAAAGGADANGTVSEGSDDELFPELAYEDSETDAEPDAPARSRTRRSQVKVTKTPETPRPASEKESEDSRESKLLKLKEDTVPSDRKLRSADSPKPEAKKHEKKPHESPKKQDSGQDEEKKAPTKKDLEAASKEELKDGKPEESSDKPEVEVVIEIESAEGCSTRTRARVSPYSRHERTRTSVTAEYTGNNSTMETSLDTTEASYREEPSLDDSYLRGLRGIRGRSSYKLLRDLKLTNPNAGRPRPAAQTSFGRPTGAVVGRKRKPSPEGGAAPRPAEGGEHAVEEMFAAHGKRMRLLDRLSMSMPFRNAARRNAEIVGINTDLPLTAPVASAPFDAFDPERIKPAPSPSEPVATPLRTPTIDRNASRCRLM